jgi:predicted Na+-dependent transporter
MPVDPDMLLGMMIAFACPTAAMATAFADQYNGDTENAVIYTLGNTVLSVITIPLLYWALTAIF